MPYTSPAIADIATQSGLNKDILGQSQVDFEAHLTDLVTLAEAELGIRLGGALTGLSLDALQIAATQQAVGYVVARRFLVAAKVRRLTGTHEPLTSEESAAYDEAIADAKVWTEELVGAVASGISGDTPSAPFALPAAGSSTFTTLSSHRTPYERNELLDETGDGISASDLTNG